MALFIVIAHDGPDGPRLRDVHRAAHVAFLDELDRAGKLPFAGPIRDDANTASVGAVLVIEAVDLADARALAARDPFAVGGVYASLTVAPFKRVFPRS
jgi:uncharacterized protein YciI